jgi:membrane-associated phospholipid phosphatase
MNQDHLSLFVSRGFLLGSACLIASAWLAAVILMSNEFNVIWMMSIHANPVFPSWIWSLLNLGGDACVALLILLVMDKRPGQLTSWLLKTWLLGFLLVQTFKHLFSMPRPASILGKENLTLIDHPPLLGGSMPSGHALAAISCGLILMAVLRSKGYTKSLIAAVGLISCSVAWSRVAVGAHWPSDVIAGAALALLILIVSTFWEIRQSWSQWFEKKSGARFLIGFHLFISLHLMNPQSDLLFIQLAQLFLAFISVYRAYVLYRDYFGNKPFDFEEKS